MGSLAENGSDSYGMGVIVFCKRLDLTRFGMFERPTKENNLKSCVVGEKSKLVVPLLDFFSLQFVHFSYVSECKDPSCDNRQRECRAFQNFHFTVLPCYYSVLF